MLPAKIRKSIVALLLLGILGLALYHVADARALEREFNEVAGRKISEVVAISPSKWQIGVESKNEVWRSIPVFGTPSAKLNLTLNVRGKSGKTFCQNFDFYFSRENTGWIEIVCGGVDRETGHRGGHASHHSH